MYTRRGLMALSPAVLTLTAGCSLLGGDDTHQEESERSQAEEGDQTEEENQTEEETETEEEIQYTEDSNTDEYVLSLLQLPDGFSLLSEEVILRSELEEGEPNYERFERNDLLRQHSNQFVEDTEVEEPGFVSSTMYVTETQSSAENLKRQQIDAFVGDTGQEQTLDGEHEIPTTFVESETDDEVLVRAYLGGNQNAVFELLVTGKLDQSIEDLYIQMLV